MNHEHHSHSENHSQHKENKPSIIKEDHANQNHDPTKANPHLKHSEMQNTGYDQHAGHHTEGFLRRFWICLILTIPILLLSHMIQQWFNFEIRFDGDSMYCLR